MAHQELLTYITAERAKGFSDENIRIALQGIGWQEADINDGFATLASGVPISQLSETPNPVSGQVSSSLPGVFELLRSSWEMYVTHWKTIVGILLVPVAVVFVVGALIGASVFTGSVSPGLVLAGMALGSIGYVVAVLFSAAAFLAFLVSNEKEMGVVEAYRRGSRKVGGYLWISILSSLIIVGGFVLFIIPGIIFAVWFMFALMMLFAEDVRGINALLASKALVSGRWFPVALRFGGIVLIVWLALFGVGFVLGMAPDVVEAPVSLLLGLIIWPLVGISMYLLYTHLRATAPNPLPTPSSSARTWCIVGAIWGIVAYILAVIAVVGMILALTIAGIPMMGDMQDSGEYVPYEYETFELPNDGEEISSEEIQRQLEMMFQEQGGVR